MRIRTLASIFIVGLVAACSSTPEEVNTSTVAGVEPVTTAPVALVNKGSKEDFVASAGDRVFFDYDQYRLRPEAKAALDRQIAWLKTYPKYTFTIEGHADERGTREYNLALGLSRANTVRDYMVTSGIDSRRVRVVSYGKERPAALGANETAWSRNRRGVTVLD